MRHETLLNRDSAAVLIIDIQEKILPAMNDAERILRRAEIFAQGAAILNLPVIVSEQYPQGLGATLAPLRAVLPDSVQIFAKKSFSAAARPEILTAIKETGATQIILGGIETHICVLQTALDLQIRGYQVHLLTDMCGSRAPDNHENAARRMQTAGIILSNSESALFEMLESAEGSDFKVISRLIR